MEKSLSQLRAEVDTLRRKKAEKESLVKLSNKRDIEKRKLKSELSNLKSPKRKAALGFTRAFFSEAGKLIAPNKKRR